MVSVSKFTKGIEENADRIKSYKRGCDGSGGQCDCVGLIIGAERLIGMKYSGIHGSNYFARYHTVALHKVTKASQLEVGQVVYKVRTPGMEKYDLPARYDSSADKNDYYHIGYVLSVNPLRIAHCSTGGMHYDTKLGKWSYAGFIKGVDYSMDGKGEEKVDPDIVGTAVVDVPNDGTVNVRKAASISSLKVDTLREGEKCEVLSVSGDWAQVEYKKTGYIMKKYLRSE